MKQDLLEILVIGDGLQRCCHTVEALEQMGCRCWFASTDEEIREALGRHSFRLALSTRPVTEGSALMMLLREPQRSVFYSIPVENGCLWFRALPETVAGQRLSGVGAGAFTRLLADLIEQLKSAGHSRSNSSSPAIIETAAHPTQRNRGGQNESTTNPSV
ncbi:MAG TPA: hypothetical protein VMJ93_01155 [Verrucomicrobiae bacterium]|nr:hypothetical protein [Verrucomicrobiae bacterium]